MASLIKSQILKHLSKFTKNLSPDKINVSTLRGEGELSNLELDEAVLTEILDLPSWLTLTKAVCNKVAIKIQWTKLKSQPICLFLDEIMVQMDTCENIRAESPGTSPISNYSTQGKYGFAERIIDGMYVSINSVIVSFRAAKFAASIQLSRIIIQSKTPTWDAGDLRLTRLKDDVRGEILIFKEAEWQTLRIEANALEGSHLTTTPLRLIANQSKIRITIKKRLLDCGLVASRLQVNLDDLLWVLTDSQLKAALIFANSLKEIINKSNQQSKLNAAEKLKRQGVLASPAHQMSRTGRANNTQMTKSQQAIAKLFSKYDVVETSYHLYTGRVDLHLCDDMTPGAERCHWLRHDENMAARDMWAQDLMATFKDDVRKVRAAFTNSSSPSSPTSSQADNHKQSPQQQVTTPPDSQAAARANMAKHTKLLESSMVFRLQDFVLFRVTTATDNKRAGGPKKFLSSEKKQLLLPPEMSSVHVEYTDYYFPEGIDFPVPHPNMYIVVNPIKLVLDFTTILWLNAFSLNLFKQVELPPDEGPKYHTDIKLDALMPRIVIPSAPEVSSQSDRPNGLQVQVSRACITNCRQEPKASLEDLDNLLQTYGACHLYKHTAFPNEAADLQILPDVFARHVAHADRPYYDQDIEDALNSDAISTDPASPMKPNPLPVDVVETRQSQSRRNLKSQSSISSMGLTYFSMRTDSFKKNSEKDIWCIVIDQFWLEFVGVPSSRHRPVPFVESFPLTLWLAKPLECTQPAHETHSSSSSCHSNLSDLAAEGDKRKPKHKNLKDYYSLEEEDQPKVDQQKVGNLHVLVKVGSKVTAQINHYQMLFLLRLLESVSKFQEELEEDSKQLLSPKELPVSKMVLAVALQEAEVALIGPPMPELPSTQTSQDDLVTDLEEDIANQIDEASNENNNMRRQKDTEDSALGASLSSAYGANTNATTADILGSTTAPPAVGNHTGQNGVLPTYNSDLSGENSPQIYISPSGAVSMEATSDSGLGGGVGGSSTPQGWSPSRTAKKQQNQQQQQPDLKKSFNSAFNSLSRGLGSGVSKISEKVSKMSLEDGSDDWEGMSMRSGSDEEEDYILLRFQNESERPAFDKSYILSQSDEESLMDGMSNYSSGAERSRGVVSVVSFRVFHIEAKVQIDGKDMTVSAQLDQLQPVEHGNVNLDKFQAKLAAERQKEMERRQQGVSRSNNTDIPPPAPSPPVTVRFAVGPAAEELAPTAGERGFLRAVVSGFRTKLQMSSINILTDLIEDEKIPPIMPMFIIVKDTDITIKDDKPPTHETSPGGQPIDLHIARAMITRTEDGVFHITGDPCPAQIPEQKLVQVPSMDSKFSYEMSPRDETSSAPRSPRSLLNKTLEEYRAENEMLTRQLEKIGRITENPEDSQKLQRENDRLFAQLTAEQELIVNLKDEREHLLSTIQFMQAELEASESNHRYRGNPPS